LQEQQAPLFAGHMQVISLLKDNNADEYRRVTEFCTSGIKPRIGCKVVTHVANLKDPKLLLRNLIRSMVHGMSAPAFTVMG
ncbi:MAG: hypothetical protein RI963_2638, partial [Planctomycetota bacterium]